MNGPIWTGWHVWGAWLALLVSTGIAAGAFMLRHTLMSKRRGDAPTRPARSDPRLPHSLELVTHLTGWLALALWVALTTEGYRLVLPGPAPGADAWAQRLCFWMMAVLSLPLILSIALNLFPLFAPSGQQALAQCHRYRALGFVLSAWSFAYWRWRAEWRKAVSPLAPTVKEISCHS